MRVAPDDRHCCNTTKVNTLLRPVLVCDSVVSVQCNFITKGPNIGPGSVGYASFDKDVEGL